MKSMKPNPCMGKKRQNQCSKKFDDEQRLQIFKLFYENGDGTWTKKLSGHMRGKCAN